MEVSHSGLSLSKRHLVVNNGRSLILPWVKVKNLGSKILRRAVKVVPMDGERIYGVKSIAFETFVDKERFPYYYSYEKGARLFIPAEKGKI